MQEIVLCVIRGSGGSGSFFGFETVLVVEGTEVAEGDETEGTVGGEVR